MLYNYNIMYMLWMTAHGYLYRESEMNIVQYGEYVLQSREQVQP